MQWERGRESVHLSYQLVVGRAVAGVPEVGDMRLECQRITHALEDAHGIMVETDSARLGIDGAGLVEDAYRRAGAPHQTGQRGPDGPVPDDGDTKAIAGMEQVDWVLSVIGQEMSVS